MRKLSLPWVMLWAIWQVSVVISGGQGLQFTDLASMASRGVHLGFAVVALALFAEVPIELNRQGKRAVWSDVIGIGGLAFALIALGVTVFASSVQYPLVVAIAGVLGIVGITYRYLSPHAAVFGGGAFLCLVVIVSIYNANVDDANAVSAAEGVVRTWFGPDGVLGPAVAVSSDYLFHFIFFGVVLRHLGVHEIFMGDNSGSTVKGSNGRSFADIVAAGAQSNTSSATLELVGPERIKQDAPNSAVPIYALAISLAQLMPPVLPAASLLIVLYSGATFKDVFFYCALLAILLFTYLDACRLVMSRGTEPGTFPRLIFAALRGVGYLFGAVILFAGMDLLDLRVVHPAAISVCAFLFALALQWSTECRDGGGSKNRLYRAVPGGLFLLLIYSAETDPGLAAFFSGAVGLLLLVTKDMMGAHVYVGSDFFRELRNAFGIITETARGTARIAISLALIGIIVSPLMAFGLGEEVTSVLLSIVAGQVWLIGVVTFLLATVIGLALPMSATYLSVVTIMAPIIVAVASSHGNFIDLIGVHLAALVFACLADVTPPDDVVTERLRRECGIEARALYAGTLKLMLPIVCFSLAVMYGALSIDYLEATFEDFIYFLSSVFAMILMSLIARDGRKFWPSSLMCIVLGACLLMPAQTLENTFSYYSEIDPTKLTDQKNKDDTESLIRWKFEGSGAAADRPLTFHMPANGHETPLLKFSELGATILKGDEGVFFISDVRIGSDAWQIGAEEEMRLSSVAQLFTPLNSYGLRALFFFVSLLLMFLSFRREGFNED